MNPKKIIHYLGILLLIMGFGAVSIGGAYAVTNHSLNSLGTTPVNFRCLSQSNALLLIQQYPPGQDYVDATCPGYNPYSSSNDYSGFYTPAATTTTQTTTTQAGSVVQPLAAIPQSGGSAQPSISLSGCNASPSSYPGDGQFTSISAVANCVITETLPSGYVWVSTGTPSTTIVTCGPGQVPTCGQTSVTYSAGNPPTSTSTSVATTTTTVTIAYCGNIPFNPAIQTCTASSTTLTTTVTEQATTTFSTTVVSTIVHNSTGTVSETIERTITLTTGRNPLPLASSVLIIYGLVLMAVGSFVTIRTRKP